MMTALMIGVALSTMAQTSEWFQNVKLSGYGMVQYQAQDKESDKTNAFNLRLVRMALEGRAHQDFYWKVQMQINGTTNTDNTAIRLVDLFGEWQKYEFFKVKAGQFKRPFTFENPMHPITQGFMSYSQNVSKLSGFSDRTGEQASNGRDLGVQIQGDFLKVGKRNLLHYQVGVFNGQGINVKDADNRKDIIGGLWVWPIEGLRIGAFGWIGSRGNMTYVAERITNADGSKTEVKKTENVEKKRCAFSAEYAKDDWTFRTEYIYSKGYGSNSIGSDGKACDKADGFYALCIAPVIKNKLHVKARYDTYRDKREWSSSKTFYEIGADYLFTKNLQLNLEYARVNERTNDLNYNLLDLELDFRF